MRVGVIGTGFGGRVVAGAFEANGCRVTEVVTARDADAVRALCRSEIDLVSVHSPPFLHRDHVAMALDAGRAVLCDKPFGRTLEDAEAMAAQADGAGVVHLVNFEFRHQPARVTMRDLLTSGAVGRPEHLAYTAYTSGSRVPLRPWGWLFDRSLGGGWVGAFGSHAIDLVRWLLGEATGAGAVTWTSIPERPGPDGTPVECDAEDSFTGWMRTASGATATVDTTFAAGVTTPARIMVTGSEGALENVGDVRLVLRRVGEPTEQFDFARPEGDGHHEAMVAWAGVVRDAVTGDAPAAPTFADGVACMRVMEQWRVGPPAGRSRRGRVAELADPLDLALDDLAGAEEARRGPAHPHPRGGAGEDHIAG
jgi:predicted dehydrogenase